MGDLPDYRATPTETGGANLRSQHDILLEQLEHLHPVERAMGYVVGATRGQFYVDGNKRTARLLMNGVLMSHGYDAISIPNRRRLEWNVHLRTLFASGEADGMLAFMLDCAPDP